ncbi:putative membrane protein [Propionispora sp. 2/2-37]|uniref:cytochrome b/b6 domain-containing protein n=1 Tax=Propionispora sp. 2/2-37 TaxID=1677858 RepID=UPI0006BB7824|nr:cytochrome b/b6 domain-containing protein [Propionispora sp. 2/2-37]CUH94403.1 putative membrane protein [Propionispora sp. 2/2-37]
MNKHEEEQARVLKHCWPSRLFHWGLILGFLPAAATGVIIWLKPGSEDFVNLAMRIHMIGAAILSLSAMTFVLTGFDRIIAFFRTTLSWGKNDLEWLKIGGGYPQKILLHKEVPVPPMDKMNSGQKLMGLVMFLGGAFLAGSGWILYGMIPYLPKVFIYWIEFGHLWIGLAMTLCIIGHIILGVYNWGEFKAMLGDGTQLLSEVKQHNPLWVANKLERLTEDEEISASRESIRKEQLSSN